MRALAARLAAEHRDTNGTVGAYSVPLARQITGDVRPALLLVWAAVGLVLLMACANLAHMLLARMLDRRQEIAIRVSLGAGRGRLMRLVFTESLLLALAGGACGCSAGRGRRRRSPTHGAGPHSAPGRAWSPGPRAVVRTGLVDSLRNPVRPAGLCAGAGRGAASGGGRSMSKPRSPLGSVLIAAEVAMAFVVLTGAALLVRSFVAIAERRSGIPRERRAGGGSSACPAAGMTARKPRASGRRN